jgi:hypothetical protein
MVIKNQKKASDIKNRKRGTHQIGCHSRACLGPGLSQAGDHSRDTHSLSQSLMAPGSGPLSECRQG